jgi:hypothetical protein
MTKTSENAQDETSENTLDGTVNSMQGDKLKMTCSQGNEHTYTVTKDAKITCEGEAAKATDVKPGCDVTVTMHKDDKTVATAVECTKA